MYGQLNSEKVAEENQICRELVREVSLMALTERQRTLIIYLLAMELENAEHMRAITTQVKEVAGQQLFLSGHVEEANNGSLDT